VQVRLFAHGVASVRYEVGLRAGGGPDDLAALVRWSASALDEAARREADEVCRRLAPAIVGPHVGGVFETYHVVLATAIEEGASTDRVAGPALARILLGELPEARLSAQTERDVTRHRFAYAEDDLCVLDWDAAFVVEPSGDPSVPDVLELVSAQLLELRYYDERLEEELLGITSLLRGPRGPLGWVRLGR
jgi:hypothetical protein